jgi:hypothetical protein
VPMRGRPQKISQQPLEPLADIDPADVFGG